MKKFFYTLLLLLTTSIIWAQTEDTTESEEEYVKTGYSIGGVPVVAYDSDLGFKYGVVVNLYDYGDGSGYPNYDQSLYLEWSNTTKGSMIAQIVYDTRSLIPGVKMIAEASYLPEQALDFYGFNGYESTYNASYEDDTNEAAYISRLFYRNQRKLFRLKADFQGQTKNENIRWLAGVAFYNTKVEPLDLAKLNKGKDESELLPDVPTLYDSYVDWNIIDESQADGGNSMFIKTGIIYDTRDNEASPNEGMWSEAILLSAPKFLANKNGGYARLMLTHRQYFTLAPERLTLAYRLSWQSEIAGTTPFYMLPYFFDSKQTQNGLGGAKNLRGVLRNRVVGDGVAMGNVELRYKFWKTKLLKQDFYIALSGFMDAGMVTKRFEINTDGVTDAYGYTEDYIRNEWFNKQDESVHIGYGAGLHFALNNNFIVALDYGMAAKKEDGSSGLYIGLNYIF